MDDIETISVMRKLRHEYGIRLSQLAACAGVSTQYLSGLELGRFYAGKRAAALVRYAFEKVAESEVRRAFQLADAYAANKDRLLTFISKESEGNS